MLREVIRKTALVGILSIYGGFLSGCMFNVSLFPDVKPLQESVLQGKGKAKVAIIDVSGVISEEGTDGMVEAPGMVARIKEGLTLAASDEAVKAVVLRINSPGGTVTASDLIYHEIQQFKRQTGRPVIAAIVDIGASGGYYIAMAADQIIAHPTSITGSIGVIMLHINLQGLMEKVGVGAESIKSGALKDMGSPTKPLSLESRQIIHGVIDDMYGRFLDVVVQGRAALTREKIKALSDGRIYTATEAKGHGLIDRIGYLDEAVEMAKTKAGIQEAQVIIYQRPHEFKTTIYSKLAAAHSPSLLGMNARDMILGGSTKFMYLWIP